MRALIYRLSDAPHVQPIGKSVIDNSGANSPTSREVKGLARNPNHELGSGARDSRRLLQVHYVLQFLKITST